MSSTTSEEKAEERGNLYTSKAFQKANPIRIMEVASIEREIINGEWPLEQLLNDNNIDSRFREILKSQSVKRGMNK